VIAVEPRLLADTLVRALERSDVEVVVNLDANTGPEESPGDTFDVAVIMDELPTGVRADVVVRLAGTADMAEGSVTTVEGTEAAALRDLTGLLETLNRFLRTD
jgi:hypothetical protein